MVNNSELRARARANLGGGIFQTTWLLTMVAILLVGAVLGVASYVVVGTIILTGPMEYGLCRVLTATARGKKDVDIISLFDAFKEDLGNAILLGLIKSVFIFLWSLLFVIPGIVKSYSYALAAFIQQDAEDKTWKTCIDQSRTMMYGKKWKLFCLDLSFIGWYILGALFFGVGVLFVAPYHEQARAEFYEDVCGGENLRHNI